MRPSARDSHTYTGLEPQSPEYSQPIGEIGTYEQSQIQPMKGANTVVSPVYQEFTDNIISNSVNTSKHNTNIAQGHTSSHNQPIRGSDSNGSANHNYFVLESQNEANNSNPAEDGLTRPTSDHQYFILEEQQGQTNPNESPNTADPNYHDYFELEQ